MASRRKSSDLFEQLALQVRARGIEHFSADAILHRIRWEFHVERGDSEYKVNNNYSAAGDGSSRNTQNFHRSFHSGKYSMTKTFDPVGRAVLMKNPYHEHRNEISVTQRHPL